MPGRSFPVDGSKPYRFGFNGQEKSDEISGAGNHNTAEFWEYDTRLVRRWNLDPKPNPSISKYAAFANNPIMLSDPLGDTVWVYATRLPMPNGVGKSALSLATHTFIIVKTNDGKYKHFAYGAENDDPFGGDRMKLIHYNQDLNVFKDKEKGIENGDYKNRILVSAPKGMTSAQFDKSVINAAESFGNNSNVKYDVFPNCDLSGNCNTSTSTILNKSGLGKGAIQNIESQIPGINTGFGDIKPWTKAEQTNAVEQTTTKDPNRIESVGDLKRETNRWMNWMPN